VASLLLILAARAIKLPWVAIALGLISAPELYCITMGQTGIFVSALLMASLGLAETQPIAAGIAAGCLIIKPQFAILLPICFLASHNWRAFVSAVATLTFLCALSGVMFGLGVWRQFLGNHAAAAPGLLAAAWPQPYQFTMVTVFMMLRSLGAGVPLAGAVQALASVGAGCGAWWLWRRGNPVDPPTRLAATLCLVAIATPYAYIYDLPGLGLALAGRAANTRWADLAPFTIFCLFTALYAVLSTFWFLTGALFLAAILISLWPTIKRARDDSPLALPL
jgi:hypothetical protein